MGHEQIQRAYSDVRLSPFVPHNRLLADRWTGVLQLRWHIDRSHPLAVGAGWFTLRGGEAPQDRRTNYGPRRMQPQRPAPVEVVAEIVRRGAEGTPVIPGSSLKGAIRQVYELLTPSCEPWPPEGCKARPNDREPRLCPACSFFGAAGLGGRAAFGEAEPAAEWKTRLTVRKVPVAWPPRRDKGGTVRVYDQRKAVTPQGQAAPERERTWTIWGDFDSEIRLVNASADELGLLFAAMGFMGPSPMLRLGGKKYDGLGAADAELRGGAQSYPARTALEASQAYRWAEELAQRAVESAPERRAAWAELHRVMSLS